MLGADEGWCPVSFRDPRQRALACRALCALAGQPDLWGPTEPTARAAELVRAPSPLSPAERVLVECAWDVWSGAGVAYVADVVAHLDRARLLAVGGLLQAIADGPAAVDAWLQTYQPPTVRRVRAAVTD